MQANSKQGLLWVMGAALWPVVAWLLLGLMEHAIFGLILERLHSITWEAAATWMPSAIMFVYGLKLFHEVPHSLTEKPPMAPDRTIDNRGGIYNEAPNSGQQTVNNTTHVHPTVREPDGLYQNGNKVGYVQGATVDPRGQSVFFQVMAFTAYPTPNTPLEFRDLVIHCDAMPKAEPGTITVSLSAASIGITCRIVGRR